MIFNIYGASFNNRKGKGVWHYTIYQDLNTKYHSSYKVVNIPPISKSYEFFIFPFCAACLYIFRKIYFRGTDGIRIMTRTSGLMGDIINRGVHLDQCPIFKKYWENVFVRFQKSITVHIIYPLMDYPGFKTHPAELDLYEQKFVNTYKRILDDT